MPLHVGARLGPYEILALIGAGGMGEVYRARDTKLKRDVALKVLPDLVASDPDRLARFHREAEVLAALNHPNIAHIYGVEESSSTHALVMELVEGPTLADRIAKGPIALNEALPIAKQIVEALEAAHEQGIIHRDLKPANIKVREDGTVKVLDFGLAKLVDPSSNLQNPSVTASPTITTPAMTQVGVILGTAAYMSPEQAKGRPADKRSDVWAFGCVLYEMITGRSPFHRHTVVETLASILNVEPDWSSLPGAVMPSIRRLVQRCLTKDPRQRLQAVGEARITLDAALSRREPTEEQPHRLLRPVVWASVVATATVAVVAGMWLLRPQSVGTSLSTELVAPKGAVLGRLGYGQVKLSPDGRYLVFMATDKDGKRMLWLRSLETGIVNPLAGTENAAGEPFWSPDSHWIVFAAGGKLQKIDVVNRRPEPICDATGVPSNSLGTWNADGVILFTQPSKPIQRVSASGGPVVDALPFDVSRNETGQRDPFFLPDGRQYLYYSSANVNGIVLASLDGIRRTFLLQQTESPASFAPDDAGAGWVLYVLRRSLMARPFDPRAGRFTGEPVSIADALLGGPSWSASTTGLLAYRRAEPADSELTWVDRDGKSLGTVGQPGQVGAPRISPDQKTIAFTHVDEGKTNIWLLDLARNQSKRLTFDSGLSPVWSPDGHILYFSQREHDRVLVERSPSGIGAERVLRSAPGLAGPAMFPTAVSSDGQRVAFSESGGGTTRGFLLARSSGEVTAVESDFRIAAATFSPDGRWFAYSALLAGHSEIFAAAVLGASAPNSEGRVQVSEAGGSAPVWSANGREIYYLTLDAKLVAVPVELAHDSIRIGIVKTLFSTGLEGRIFRDYDVSSDGRRFVIAKPLESGGDVPITLVANWPGLIHHR